MLLGSILLLVLAVQRNRKERGKGKERERRVERGGCGVGLTWPFPDRETVVRRASKNGADSERLVEPRAPALFV